MNLVAVGAKFVDHHRAANGVAHAVADDAVQNFHVSLLDNVSGFSPA